MKSLNTVSNKEVFDFKETYCNENNIIIKLLNGQIRDYIIEPILDVGCGIGDIAYNAFVNRKAYLIDINSVTDDLYPIRTEHTRTTVDFFDYTPPEKINTIFIGHVLQFLDDRIENLYEKIEDINARYIIIVKNLNNDFFGEILTWIYHNKIESNPEVEVSNFPKDYSLIKIIPFESELSCNSFEELAEQISYVMKFDLSENRYKTIDFLENKLEYPKIIFNQSIDIYQKDETG